MRVLLMDGDILCRRAAHAASARGEGERAACARLDAALDRLQAALHGDRLLAALGRGASFRKQLDPGYKSARRKPPPAGLSATRARLSERVETRSALGLEADDLLGIWATAPDLSFAAPEPEREKRLSHVVERVVLSGDKDLLSIPGLQGAPNGRIWRVAPEEADLRHLAQTLIGDPVDGYRGCPGVGVKRAAALLTSVDPWRAVRDAFAAKGLGLERALLQARLARILRHGEVDLETGAPILWTPPRLRRAARPDLVRRALAPFRPVRERSST